MSPTILRTTETLSNLAIEWVYASPALEITRYRCLVGHHHEGREQAQPGHVIGFPHSGAFELHMHRERTVIDSNLVMFHNAWTPYTTQHPAECCDTGSAIALRPDLLVEIVRRHDEGVSERPETPFAADHAPLSSQAVLVERLLSRYLAESRRHDDLMVEETAFHLVDEVVAIPYRLGRAHPRSSGEAAV